MSTTGELNSQLSSWPVGSAIQQIAYVVEATSGQVIAMEFPPPLRMCAVVTASAAGPDGGPGELTILTVPAPVRETMSDDETALFARMQMWVEAASPAHGPASQIMMFQGARICWTPGRIALLVLPERIESARRALIEVSYYDAELRAIEHQLGQDWSHMEADMPLAFEVTENTLSQRQQLRQRFLKILQMRTRLTRLSGHIHCPHLHPPTLASQIGERFRDRTRMELRYEIIDEQIEVFEGVYEMCGQRASDYMLTRSGNILEWIIIILLVAQLLLSGIEMLAGSNTEAPTTTSSLPSTTASTGQ